MAVGGKNENIFVKASELLTKAVRFITYDIWRITENDVSSRLKRSYIYLTKTIILAVRGFKNDNISTRASALTYSTLLAVVPMLAVIVGVAGGFGVREDVQNSLYSWFSGQTYILDKVFGFANNYIKISRNGLFIGIGFVLLLYTVINLISTIENAFNDIWQIKKSRPWYRKITDYLAFFVILPALMMVSSGLSIFLSTLRESFLQEYDFLTPLANTLLQIAPFVIMVLFFTVLYMLVPNTKVRFLNALSAGFIVGISFQIFQYLYISGQIWVSKYNAVYGSFAALPLLLLWLQISWLMCLFGAEIAYASQNVRKFSFESDTKNISRRYKDFLTVLIASLIVKRFESNEAPYTADELSVKNRIPIRLTTDILYLLEEIGIIDEVKSGDDDRVIHYKPAMDISKLSVGMLLQKIDEHGSESFKIDTEKRFAKEWNALLKTRKDLIEPNANVLLKEI